MTLRPVAEQRPLAEVLSAHLGQPRRALPRRVLQLRCLADGRAGRWRRAGHVRRRAVVTEGDVDTPSNTVLRPGLAIKPTPSRVIPKAITAEFGSGPTGVYDLHRYCGWKERIEEVGRMYVFG
ncbi:MAG: hypothetical protein HY207_07890 [Nitrospirae bacterium]|nr:hypothetical protein [Nitrospirota bacterium]